MGYPNVRATDVGSADATALDGALRLARGKTDEEQFLGLALALRQPALLTSEPAMRSKLFAVVEDGAFLQRLLSSSSPCQRVALATLRILIMDAKAAESLLCCALPLAQAWDKATASPIGSEEEPPWGAAESQEAAEGLRQFARFIGPRPALLEETVPHIKNAVQSIKDLLVDDDPALLDAVLALLQEITSLGLWDVIPDGLLEGLSLSLMKAKSARSCFEAGGRVSRVLGLLSERLEAGVITGGEQLGEILDASLAAGAGNATGAASARAVALRLAAGALGAQGKPKALAQSRLLPILSLSMVETRLALETTEPGEATLQALCGACMCMETAVSVLASMADDDENETQSAREAQTCLSSLHRSLVEVFDFCEQLPKTGTSPPPQLALLARAVGAYQAEEPMKFAPEFRRSLGVFHMLPPAEFMVLLPGIQALPDWHLTPALGKIFDVLKWASDPTVQKDVDALQAWRQAALMVTEVALDPAAYLPEAPLPSAPPTTSMLPGTGSSANHTPVEPWPRGVPRPAVAADPEHPGVQQLVSWSQVLWEQGVPRHNRAGTSATDKWALATLCSSLVVSAPEPALTRLNKGMWDVVAINLLPGPTAEDDNPLWRLSLRLCAFALDRNSILASAFLAATKKRYSQGLPRFAPPSVWAAVFSNEGDEWAEDDESAVGYLRRFVGE